MTLMVATGQWGTRRHGFGQVGTREKFRDRDDVHGTSAERTFTLHAKEEKYVELPREMWSKGCPEYGRLRVSLYGTRDAAAKTGRMRTTTYCGKHQFDRGVAWSMFIPITFERNPNCLSHGDDFMSGRTQAPAEMAGRSHGQNTSSRSTQ